MAVLSENTLCSPARASGNEVQALLVPAGFWGKEEGGDPFISLAGCPSSVIHPSLQRLWPGLGKNALIFAGLF